MTRATPSLAGLLREPDNASFRAWLRFVGRLVVLYLAIGLLAALPVILAAAVIAMTMDRASASAPQTPPDTPRPRGCAVILPDPADHEDHPATLRVHTLRPLDECDGSAPVGFGASVRDGYTGKAR